MDDKTDDKAVGVTAKRVLSSLTGHGLVVPTDEKAKNALVELTDLFLERIDKPAKVVLEEDDYIERISAIIERDFFPHLEQFKAQEDFMEAVGADDVTKLQNLIAKYGRSYLSNTLTPFMINSPSTFDTPAPGRTGDAERRNPSPPSMSGSNPGGSGKKPSRGMGLNAFMQKHTSEDNMSFEEICQLQGIAQKLKNSWIYQAEEKAKERFAIQQARHQAIEGKEGSERPDHRTLDTWPYVARNMLMFNPEGIDVALQEKVTNAKKAGMQICHENTRFQPGFLAQQAASARLGEHVTAAKAIKKGHVGADGLDVVGENQNHSVNGYSILGTPSPMPGVGADSSPAMIWGNIDSTPAHLSDGGSRTPGGAPTPLFSSSKTPAFKIPEIPVRDRLGHELAERAAKNHRAKKTRALNEVQSRLAGKSPSFGSVRSSTGVGKRAGTDSMSPAAQKLLANRLKFRGADAALRSSYSPAANRKTSLVTPKTLAASPMSSRSSKSPAIVQPASRNSTPLVESLTDNLMELRNSTAASDKTDAKRSSAADFF